MKKFRLAKTVSKLSEYSVKVGAVIYKGNKVISTGYNKLKSHPIFANEDRFFSLHAEMSAIINAKCDLTGCIMYVYREFSDGSVALAKPCKWCMPSIIEAGITTIFYTDEKQNKGWSKINLKIDK